MIDQDYSKSITLENGRRVLLRLPTESDIETIRRSVNEIIAEDTYFLLTEPVSYEGEVEFLTPVFKAIKESRAFWLYVFDGNRVLGWVSASELSPRSPHVRELGICLLPEVRGVGLGEILMKEAEILAKNKIGCEMLILHVAEHNERARKLYRNAGYIETGRVPDMVEYKGVRMGHITMYKQL